MVKEINGELRDLTLRSEEPTTIWELGSEINQTITEKSIRSLKDVEDRVEIRQSLLADPDGAVLASDVAQSVLDQINRDVCMEEVKTAGNTVATKSLSAF